MNISEVGELYLKLGFVGLIIVIFLSLFLYMIVKQMKILDKIYKDLYTDNANNLTLQSSYDIIEAQYLMSKYALVETIMRIYHENNVHDSKRQSLIKNNIEIIVRNLYDRDITVLSKLKYKDVHLHEYLENHINHFEVSDMIYEKLINQYSPVDILTVLDNTFNRYINVTTKYIDKKAK